MDDETLKTYHQGYNEGMKYSPDTARINDILKVEFEGVRSEWDTFKKNFIAACGVVALLLVGYGMWVGGIQTTVNNHDKHIEEIAVKVEKINIDYVRIETQLVAINKGIEELKQGRR